MNRVVVLESKLRLEFRLESIFAGLGLELGLESTELGLGLGLELEDLEIGLGLETFYSKSTIASPSIHFEFLVDYLFCVFFLNLNQLFFRDKLWIFSHEGIFSANIEHGYLTSCCQPLFLKVQ